MNAKRRKALRAIITRLEDLDSLRQEILEQLQEIQDEEQEALDNLPEGLQESERGQRMQECVDGMEYAMDMIDALDVEEITDQLQEVVEG